MNKKFDKARLILSAALILGALLNIVLMNKLPNPGAVVAEDTPEEAVVLSVIKALGGLGDKAAFDYLLYATYLDYPSDVTDAARLALAKLKW